MRTTSNGQRVRKYRTEKEMHQSLINACHGKFRMCVPMEDSDDDNVLSDAIDELVERRKENPQRDEAKEVLEPLLKQYQELRERSLSVHRITCDGALQAIRYEAIITIIVEIADKLGIELSVEEVVSCLVGTATTYGQAGLYATSSMSE
jgi:hypothetical protein